MSKTFDDLPIQYRRLINEYGNHAIKALRNAIYNGTPIDTVERELNKLRSQNRI
jgi:hypothetical protein